MTVPLGSIRAVRGALANGAIQPSRLAAQALANSSRSASLNTYLWQDAQWTHAEAARVEAMPATTGGSFGDGRDTLWGLPVSVKDCFDLAGAATSCGVKFYRDSNGVAAHDSWVVDRLRKAGAVITGKTHLHPLAYGITGENPEFGDCLQPDKHCSLTGGSSSGAAASVLEGSAIAAIGTDTGGSIRVPAALCGLAGYRSSLGRGDWNGGAHLAQSFDTLGWLFSDLEDAALLGGFFAPANFISSRNYTRFAIVDERFLHDCEPGILASYRQAIADLEALGLRAASIDVEWWSDSSEIFAPIQAWEAARIHSGNFHHFETVIRERLEWGARITTSEIAALRQRHVEFKTRLNELFAKHELILMPAAPVARLEAGADHSKTRARLLRYTTPFSLGGLPAVTIPCPTGGMQLAAARDNDEGLLQLASVLGTHQKSAAAALNV